jgi:hypothetical protein
MRHNRRPVESGVLGVNEAKASVTAGVCVPVIGNMNVPSNAWGANLLAGMLCGFFGVKMKFFRVSSAFQQLFSLFQLLVESHSTGVKPPKTFPFVSKITIRVFAWPSQRL